MNEKIKKKWIKALRSGKYRQASNVLLNPTTGGMCCLGVLCRITGVSDKFMLANPIEIKGRGFGRAMNSLSIGVKQQLAKKNDNGSRFPAIANWIEKNL